MPRWIWIVIALCVSSSVYFVIRYGLRPKPIPVMNPTEFQASDQIGIVAYKRLRQNLRAERLVVFGLDANSPREIEFLNGFIRAAENDGQKTVSFQGESLQTPDALQNVGKTLREGRTLSVVAAPTSEVSHLVKGSMSGRLEKIVGHPVLSISLLPLAIDKEAYDEVQTHCLDATESQSVAQRLDCAKQRVARKYLKRHLAPEKIWAVMERHGLKEYLVFVYHPATL